VSDPAVGGITGRYAGPVTRLAAFAVDSAVIVAGYGLVTAVVAFTLRSVLRLDITLDQPDSGWWAVLYLVWAFLYQVVGLAISGRTLGKWLAGVRVVGRDGSPIRPRSAVVRVLTLPLSFAVFGLGLVGLLVGRERRALHDVLAGTVVVYDWGDRRAELPGPLTRFLEREGALAPPASDQAGEVSPVLPSQDR
jgi:uncharacterized RDD family membrane protein YckC